MKLSQAILTGCKLFPYHSPRVPHDGTNGTNTVGAAYAALFGGNREFVRVYQTDFDFSRFPIRLHWARCPIAHRDYMVDDIIRRLEDPKGHRAWSRERIAKWVEGVEKRLERRL